MFRIFVYNSGVYFIQAATGAFPKATVTMMGVICKEAEAAMDTIAAAAAALSE